MLASDSFLPSGFTDHDPNMPPSALISPLSLSRMTTSSNFDTRSISNSGNNPIYSPQVNQHHGFLSPNGLNGLNGAHSFNAALYQPRSASFSPTNVDGFLAYRPTAPVATTFARVSPNGMPHPRSVSADAASAPDSAQIIKKLAQQVERVRGAWEAERKYSEANRERVEEVYKEERAIMEMERDAWEQEKASLQEQVIRLRDENNQLQQALQMVQLEKAGKVAGVTVAFPGPGTHPGTLAHAGGAAGSTEVAYPGFSSHPNDARFGPSQGTGARRPTNGSASASVSPAQIRSQFISPPSSRISPSRQPEISPFIPLNPNMQPTTQVAVDFLGSPKDETPVPIVDIQIINPQLEGVPLKAPAIQKSTFTDLGVTPENSKASSRNVSPPGEPGKIFSPNKEHTIEVLAAPEVDRLVMHAGHTPSHSLSHLGTAPGTEVPTAADGTGGSTPTLAPTDMSSNPATLCDVKARDGSSDVEDDVDGDGTLEPQPTLDATDDAPLKGPLCLRNNPTHDELFFQKLDGKLEDVSRGEDAVPTCLRDSAEDLLAVISEHKENDITVVSDTDGTIDDDGEAPSKREEVDIPLKLKKSTNFGAPMGSLF
ncbi:hypothetical protein C8035_v001590 [Colletotrichum spinosum]|uniref:Uncharacterized protein n=1 Tax=Colletotrichum spinosum TaxID=1347390 RepID=A0A4R8QC74_9PEZI|nr:hypothetical protein C8035_v001590 [Colletotrichum spinosum]